MHAIDVLESNQVWVCAYRVLLAAVDEVGVGEDRRDDHRKVRSIFTGKCGGTDILLPATSVVGRPMAMRHEQTQSRASRPPT